VRVRVDAFALTANNVTYGAFGAAMHYWEFYPDARGRLGHRAGLGLFGTVVHIAASRRGRGRTPVWLLADGEQRDPAAGQAR
jgi:hypothetical protein